MLRVAGLAFVVGWFISLGAVRADDGRLQFPTPQVCGIQPDDPTIAAGEKAVWTDCEKWIWSCVRQGLEADLFSKKCLRRGTTEHSVARSKWRLAPFFDPDRYLVSNAVGEKFLETILTVAAYRDVIPPMGVRIFGAYFSGPVNLENFSVTTNLVLDGAIMKRGLRLTNFSSTKNLSLDGANIRGSLLLMRSRIAGSIYMEYGVYDTVDLRDARIGASFEGTGSVFNGEFRFDRAHIDGKVVLTKSRLTILRAELMQVGGEFDMRIADIRLGMNLGGSVVAGDVRLPELTFGRRGTSFPANCDWIPELDTENLLNRVSKVEASQAIIDAGLFEVVGSRPMYGGRPPKNLCSTVDEAGALETLSSVLLRNMRIEGTLCLVDVTGEIAAPKDTPHQRSIATISLDGTTAKSTILRWKDSKSQTLWHAVNFKTGHLLIDLENQPQLNYFDNVDIGAITFLTAGATDQIASVAKGSESEVDLLKTKCDVTPVASNTQRLDDVASQRRIIDFFSKNTSRSVQPFTNFVARLEATGLDTTRLKIGLSELQFRNTCSTSRLTMEMKDRGWLGLRASLGSANVQEYYRFTLDVFCAAGYTGYKYAVSYGHRPLNLILWAFLFVILLYVALWFDRRDPQAIEASRHPGLTYVIDNLIPFKHYRFDHPKAEKAPQRSWLKAHVQMHRAFGFMLAILAFFFIYRASK